MPRKRPENRFNELIRHGVDAVIAAKGFRRMQMEDVAARMGVSKATLYLYVESKEALFDLLVRHGDDWEAYEPPPDLPLGTPDPNETLAHIQQRIETNESFNALLKLLEGPGSGDAAADIRQVVLTLYRVQSENRRTIKLIDISAGEYPELAALWYTMGRHAVMTRFVGFLQRGIAAGRVSPMPDVALAARMVVEVCAYWSMHRHWDAEPITIDEEDVEATIVALAERFLLAPSPAGPKRKSPAQRLTDSESSEPPQQESLF